MIKLSMNRKQIWVTRMIRTDIYDKFSSYIGLHGMKCKILHNDIWTPEGIFNCVDIAIEDPVISKLSIVDKWITENWNSIIEFPRG